MSERKTLAWIGSLATAALVGFGLIATPAAVAAPPVEDGDTVWVGSEIYYSGAAFMFPIYSEVPADPDNPGTPDYYAFCLENGEDAQEDSPGTVGSVADFLGDNFFSTDPDTAGEVRWVLEHGYPALTLAEFGAQVGAPGITEAEALGAMTTAIWSLTDLGFWAPWVWAEGPNTSVAYWWFADNMPVGGSPVTDVTVSITPPGGTFATGSLVGPYTIATSAASVELTTDPAVDLTDAAGNPIDAAAVVDGQQVYLDVRESSEAGSTTITATAEGSGATGKIISVQNGSGGANPPTEEDHGQSMIMVAASGATTTAEAEAEWDGPAIGTSLELSTGGKLVPLTGGTLIDTVSYSGLTVGFDYAVFGKLVLKADGTDTGITGESELFVPASPDGTVEVEFTVTAEQAEQYAGQELVAFEELWTYSFAFPAVVATHEDLNDAAQTVAVDEPLTPAIGTTLTVSPGGGKVLMWSGGTLTDTVAYSGLTPGVEYTLSGELMDKLDSSATGITGTMTFTPTTADGTVDVQFTVPAGYAGSTLVAFERLYEGDGTVPVATHEDIEDAAQTITVAVEPGTPAIGTTLTVSPGGGKVLPWTGGTLTDTVAYSGLTPGVEYTLEGVLMDRAAGTSTGLTGQATFTPTASSGTVEVEFTVPAGYAGSTLVAFERLYEGDGTVPVATHEDIEDAAQTITVAVEPGTPAIGTTLAVSPGGGKVLPWSGGSLTDTVAYENLTPGVEYTLSGELMDKLDGSATGITGTVTFTPTTADGTVEVEFTVPDGYAGTTLVAFEDLFEGEGDVPVAVHRDINDAAQTVTVQLRPTAISPQMPNTGSELPVAPLGLGALLALAGIALLIARRRTA